MKIFFYINILASLCLVSIKRKKLFNIIEKVINNAYFYQNFNLLLPKSLFHEFSIHWPFSYNKSKKELQSHNYHYESLYNPYPTLKANSNVPVNSFIIFLSKNYFNTKFYTRNCGCDNHY